MYKVLRDILNLAKEELNKNGNIGYTMPDGKHHFFIYVDDSLGDDYLWYIIEPNKVDENGCHDPMGTTTDTPYDDFASLLIGVLQLIEVYSINCE